MKKGKKPGEGPGKKPRRRPPGSLGPAKVRSVATFRQFNEKALSETIHDLGKLLDRTDNVQARKEIAQEIMNARQALFEKWAEMKAAELPPIIIKNPIRTIDQAQAIWEGIGRKDLSLRQQIRRANALMGLSTGQAFNYFNTLRLRRVRRLREGKK